MHLRANCPTFFQETVRRNGSLANCHQASIAIASHS
jgi:hypothetical protein